MSRPALVIFGIIAGILAGIVFLEITLRISGKCGIQSYRTKYYLGEEASRYFVASDDPLLGWEHNRSWPGVNSLGFTGKERAIKKDRGTFRIIVLGDSITDGGTFVEGLENLLNSAGMGKRFEAWNCGVGCYGLRQYAEFIDKRAYKYDPDMLVICFCMNDLEESGVACLSENGQLTTYCFQEMEGALGKRNIPVNKFLLFHSRAYRFFLPGLFGKGRYDAYRNNIDKLDVIVKRAEKERTPVIAVLIPYLKSRYDRFEKRGYTVLKGMLKDRGIKYLDLHGEFPDIDNPSWRDQKDDFIHPSQKGDDLIAVRLFKYMKENRADWLSNP